MYTLMSEFCNEKNAKFAARTKISADLLLGEGVVIYCSHVADVTSNELDTAYFRAFSAHTGVFGW